MIAIGLWVVAAGVAAVSLEAASVLFGVAGLLIRLASDRPTANRHGAARD